MNSHWKNNSNWKTVNHDCLKSWARQWEPRAKIAGTVLFILGIISLDTPFLLLIAFAGMVALALSAGLPPGFLASRLAIILPFLILMSVPLVLGAGWPPDVDRALFASLIALKALTSMTAMVILLNTQPLQEFLDGLAYMKIPPLLVTLLFLAYRYVFLFFEELKKTQRALRSRFFQAGLNRHALSVYGELSGGMFIKSLDRSENVYRAMASRCFNGRLPVLCSRFVTRVDIGKSALLVAAAALLIVLERWWL